ncbi:MAG: DUF2321 domain-containing protein [Anaerolineales bacterium]|nr:DUF2321 domain-containing protein [Anaerolineales bacterium]
MGWYDISQICLNGHVITDRAKSSPEFMKKYCTKCGEATITSCQHCDTPILGDYQVEGITAISLSKPKAPGFCHECGHPYPWTLRKINIAKELGDELDNLSKEDQDKFKSTLDDLVTDNPRTELAVIRFKKIMSKVGKDSYEAIKSILVDIVSETVRKSIFGN